MSFRFFVNDVWALAIQPALAVLGLLILTRRMRGVARLLPLGLGFLPCVAVMFVSARHFIAARYVIPSVIWYHVGSCVTLFAGIDRLRLALPQVGRTALLAPLGAWLAFAGLLGARLREYPQGFNVGTNDYRGLQRYFVAHLAQDTAFVSYNGFFGEVLFGKEYRVGSQPIRLEKFHRVRGIDRYLIAEIHIDDERRPELESLVETKLGISVEQWRALPVIAVPHSIYQYPVQARVVQLPHESRPRDPIGSRRHGELRDDGAASAIAQSWNLPMAELVPNRPTYRRRVALKQGVSVRIVGQLRNHARDSLDNT